MYKCSADNCQHKVKFVCKCKNALTQWCDTHVPLHMLLNVPHDLERLGILYTSEEQEVNLAKARNIISTYHLLEQAFLSCNHEFCSILKADLEPLFRKTVSEKSVFEGFVDKHSQDSYVSKEDFKAVESLQYQEIARLSIELVNKLETKVTEVKQNLNYYVQRLNELAWFSDGKGKINGGASLVFGKQEKAPLIPPPLRNPANLNGQTKYPQIKQPPKFEDFVNLAGGRNIKDTGYNTYETSTQPDPNFNPQAYLPSQNPNFIIQALPSPHPQRPNVIGQPNIPPPLTMPSVPLYFPGQVLPAPPIKRK